MRQLTDSERAAMEIAWKEHLWDDPEMASFISFEVGFIAALDHAAGRLAALKNMLHIFDNNLPENSIGRQLCDEARQALANPGEEL